MPGPNTRLRAAMADVGLTCAALAREAQVDTKSAERWVQQGRTPHPGTRTVVAGLLDQDEADLWPSTQPTPTQGSVEQAGLARVWLSRDRVPGTVWRDLIDRTREQLDVLAYSGGFLVESFRLVDRIRAISDAGGQARILLGDPSGAATRERGAAEGLPSLPARAASTLEYLAPVRELSGVQVRVHDVPLYVSIYRFDNEMLVNPHTHGLPAKDNPVLDVRPTPEPGLLDYYAGAFERAWDTGHDLKEGTTAHG